MTMKSMTPAELAYQLEHGGTSVSLLDVREEDEFAFCRIEGARNIPLSLLPGQLTALDRETHWVVICHHGIRSAFACDLMINHGFSQVTNLSGGIDAWSDTVDPTVPKY